MRQELYIVTRTDKMNLRMLTIQNDERKEQEPETEKIQAITRNGNNNNNPKKVTASELNFNQLSAIYKRILVVDDDPDITLTFKTALEGNNDDNNNRIFEVYTYNDPILALSEFKPHFYDLMLIDINMPDLNGFELCEQIVKIDVNVKVCFMSAGEINDKALREVYPKISIGCFIKKPVTIDYLVKRLLAELA